MADDDARRIILDRANRLLQQSKTLRKLSDELLQESNDVRAAVKRQSSKKPKRSRS